MPPKVQEIEMSWALVKDVCTSADMERLACLGVAFLNAGSVDKSIYQTAADQFGGDIKPDSYKRSIWVISNKIKNASSGGTPSSKPTPGKKGRKRKATPNEDDSEGDDFGKTTKAKKSQKMLSPSPDDLSDALSIKEECN